MLGKGVITVTQTGQMVIFGGLDRPLKKADWKEDEDMLGTVNIEEGAELLLAQLAMQAESMTLKGL